MIEHPTKTIKKRINNQHWFYNVDGKYNERCVFSKLNNELLYNHHERESISSLKNLDSISFLYVRTCSNCIL